MSTYVNQCRQKTTKSQKNKLKNIVHFGESTDERMGVLCGIVTYGGYE